MMDGSTVAGLSTPLCASTSDIAVLSTTNTTGKADIKIADTDLSCPAPDQFFHQFNQDLTQMADAPFRLTGHSWTIVTMAIGNIALNPINVDVTTSLQGRQGLLKLAIGDLTLQLIRDGATLGTALFPGLVLDLGIGQEQRVLHVYVQGISHHHLRISTLLAARTSNLSSLDHGQPSGFENKALDEAALEILSRTGRSSNVSHVTVTLTNPFTVYLEITGITSTVSAFGLTLGTIYSDTKFSNKGKSSTSPTLDLQMKSTLQRSSPLLIVQLGGIQYPPHAATNSSPVKRHFARDNIFTGFDLPSCVQRASTRLQSDVELTAGVQVNIGDYATKLTYSQLPIVQKIVGGSQLGRRITNASPFDASIAFGGLGLKVCNGFPIGHIKMDPLKVVADSGASLNTKSTFTVADVGHLTDFIKTLLTQESFDWAITGENLTCSFFNVCSRSLMHPSVSAPGIDVSSITAAYSVTLKGFNGLKGESRSKPLIRHPTTPLALSSLSFDTFAGGVKIVSSSRQSLPPILHSQVDSFLNSSNEERGSRRGVGCAQPIVHGQDSDVPVQDAGASSSKVMWLNEGVETLQVATVLPNRGKLDIIKSISLNQLKRALEQTDHQGNLAELKGPSKTDVDSRITHLTFTDVPFAAVDGVHSRFDTFVADTIVNKERWGLTGIDFPVDPTIDGLHLDFNHYLLMEADSLLFNPKAAQQLDYRRDRWFGGFGKFSAPRDVVIVLSANLILPRNESYAIDVHCPPQAGHSNTVIAGSTRSTPIQSFKSALHKITLSPATIPALHQKLISSTTIGFPIDIIVTGTAQASFALANPSTASINLLTVGANATFHGISVFSRRYICIQHRVEALDPNTDSDASL
ncbi:hypothetical protein MKEN_01083400 [Mycena kentingensis (nom. inval.)]|nr:hypothetical protein MKEN_01083400 [Mycena kentingensis (nom. inval.)]